jgi:glycosyltransferase involved in cell wall biosynthesis
VPEKRRCGPVRVVFVDLHGSFLGAQRVPIDFLEAAPGTLAPSVVFAGEERMLRELTRVGVPRSAVPMPAAIARVTRGRAPGPAGMAATVAYARSVGRAVRDFSPHLVVANTPKAYVMAAVALPRGVPLAIRLHDILRPTSHLRFIARFLAHRYQSVSCVSEAVRRSAIDLGFPPAKLVTLHNGAPSPAASVRGNPGACGPTVGVVAQLEPWKGQDLALAAFARSLGDTPGSRLRIIGRPVKSSLFRRLLEARAQILGIADRVTFETDLERREEIYPGLSALVHLPRLPEPFGMVLVEAMAFGVPVVAAADGGAPEIVRHEFSGLLVPPGDTDAAAEALRRLIYEPRLAGLLARNGLDVVNNRLSSENHASAMTDWIIEHATPTGVRNQRA